MKTLTVLKWFLRFIILVMLFLVFYIGGAQLVSGLLPNIESEPGLVSAETGVLIIGIVNTLLIIGLIRSSRWSSWKLAGVLSFSYYGVVTFIMQIETWYFLSDITVGPQLLLRLFLMGIPVAFFFIPVAVWILGKGDLKNDVVPTGGLIMPIKQLALKLAVIAMVYIILYWSAGYFIAWQNEELRQFYGSTGEILPFWVHTANTLRDDPGLLFFQIFRSMMWTACALPIIWGSRINKGGRTILVGLFFSLPQNIGHILPNPLIPIASVRLSHMIETASSTFIFGMIVVWLLHREHKSIKDLFGMDRNSELNKVFP